MQIVRGAAVPVHQRRVLATALIDAFGRQYPEWSVDEAIAELASDDLKVQSVIAIVDDLAVGCASLLDDDEVDGWNDHAWLGNVVVLAEHRRKGIGRALARAIETLALDSQLEELHLVTDTGVQWYERDGWTLCGTASVHGHPMTVMRKRLAIASD